MSVSQMPPADPPVSVPRGPFTPEELMEARRPSLEDVMLEAIGALELASWVGYSNGDRDCPIPDRARFLLGILTERAARHVSELYKAMPGRLAVTAVEDVGTWDGGVA